MSLMDDFMLLMRARVSTFEEAAAINRLRAFIEQHEPWLPPQQDGFGPWIEYRVGDKGPRVNEVVAILNRYERDNKIYQFEEKTAEFWRWRLDGVVNDIVAYCVKLEGNE